MERIKITKINDHIWLLNDNNEAKSLNINLSNRKRKFCSVNGNTKQASCDNDVIIRSVFTKVFERGQGTCLFITKDEVANSFLMYILKIAEKKEKIYV